MERAPTQRTCLWGTSTLHGTKRAHHNATITYVHVSAPTKPNDTCRQEPERQRTPTLGLIMDSWQSACSSQQPAARVAIGAPQGHCGDARCSVFRVFEKGPSKLIMSLENVVPQSVDLSANEIPILGRGCSTPEVSLV
jgi:hypothetical protein